MKLIIDIPESMYEGVMIDRVLDTTVIRILDEIKNGIPLDKIRAEIKALTDGAEPERIWNVDVLQIIDKYVR
jgi:hypothetical protein